MEIVVARQRCRLGRGIREDGISKQLPVSPRPGDFLPRIELFISPGERFMDFGLDVLPVKQVAKGEARGGNGTMDEVRPLRVR